MKNSTAAVLCASALSTAAVLILSDKEVAEQFLKSVGGLFLFGGFIAFMKFMWENARVNVKMF